MKGFSTFLLCLSLAIFAHAQKINIKNETFYYHAVQLPTKVLGPEVKTYSRNVTNNSQELWKAGMTKTGIESTWLQLHGFELAENGGDLEVLLDIGAFTLISEEQKKTMKTLKGGSAESNQQYHYDFVYTLPLRVRVLQEGRLIYEDEEAGKASFSSKKFPNYKTAVDNWKRNREIWLRNRQREHVEGMCPKLHNNLNARFGYRPGKEFVKLEYAKVKKAPELEGLQQEVMAMVELLSTIKADQPIATATREAATKQAAAWAKSAEQYSVEDKQEAKLAGAYLRNAMVTAFAVEDFEAAAQYANRLIELDENKRNAEKMLEEMAEINTTFSTMGLSSRHYAQATADGASTTEAEQADAAAEASEEELRRIALNLHEKAQEFPVTLSLRSGGTQTGIFVVDFSRYDDIVFYSNHNIAYYREDENGVIDRLKLNFRELSEIEMGDRRFIFVKPTSIVGNQSTLNVMEVLAETDKVALYRRLPTAVADTKATQLREPLLLRKAGEEDFADLNNMKFMNFKKSFSKYISDCPALADRVSSGEIKPTTEDLLEVVRAYTDCAN